MSDQKIPFAAANFSRPPRSAPPRPLAMPAVLRAAGTPVKLGVLHPVTGALSYSGPQGRLGAMLAIEEINAAGGIKSLGGAKIEPCSATRSRRPKAAPPRSRR